MSAVSNSTTAGATTCHRTVAHTATNATRTPIAIGPMPALWMSSLDQTAATTSAATTIPARHTPGGTRWITSRRSPSPPHLFCEAAEPPRTTRQLVPLLGVGAEHDEDVLHPLCR